MRKTSALVVLAAFMLLPKGDLAAAFSADGDVSLPRVEGKVGVDLTTALAGRRSVKEFSSEDVSLEKLSRILWAGNGVNRPDGKRTAPTAYGKNFIDLYVISDRGAWRYDAEAHALRLVTVNHFKKDIARQSYVTGAPYVIAITADISEFPFHVDTESKKMQANATAGAIGENIYLMAGALDLGTVIISSFNVKRLSEGLRLKGQETPLYVMPVGHPR